ncbi:DNA repair protein RadC [Candidatus Dojkabacteria bacterium]|nr:DNA repair protein RadC [Candidatus Dojkabacteria bacterium]
MHSKYKFKEVNSDNLPREKLIQNGPDSLSNSELLSIIFLTGTRVENVLELSNRVIKEYGSRSITEIKDASKVSELLGLGQSKSAQLVAVFELGRRFYREQSQRLPVVRGPEDVFLLFENMGKLKKEELRALYLNSRQVVIREELISLGSENMNIVTPKEIIQPAVELMAKGILILHNHPSGLTEPSSEDIEFTSKLKEACKIMQVQLLDHIIIAGNSFLSFANERLL